MTCYVRGLLSDVQRKNVEAIALDQDVRPRTLQRLLESIAWDEAAVRDRCQEIIATEHSHPEAIGTVDETGTAKSGNHICGVKRQYNGNTTAIVVRLKTASTTWHRPSPRRRSVA